MSKTELRITGMTCGHCVASVTKALKAVPGVSSAEVSLEEGRAVVLGTADQKQLLQAVQGQGYEAAVMK